jgi:hypothetical protein
MRILSVRQPWAWAIIHAGKTIENRSWCTDYRGPVLIHAGKGWDGDAYEMHVECLGDAGISIPELPKGNLARGAIVGVANLVDVITTCCEDEVVEAQGLGDRDLAWWNRLAFGFVLKDARPLAKPITCRGYLGLYRPSPELVAEVERAA